MNSEDSSEFIYNLKPCEFKMINGTSNRYHHGFIAQQVKETMKDDWGLFIDKRLIMITTKHKSQTKTEIQLKS